MDRIVKKIFVIIAAMIFASFVLITSIVRTTSPKYVFYGHLPSDNKNQKSAAGVDYVLPYPGILPDHFLWPAKALRDKIWLLLTKDDKRRAELKLLFADKRIAMADILAKKGNAELAVVTAQKAEMYLEKALSALEGINGDISQILTQIAKASLKHEEVLLAMKNYVPVDATPLIEKVLETTRRVYQKSSQELNERQLPVPERVFSKER